METSKQKTNATTGIILAMLDRPRMLKAANAAGLMTEGKSDEQLSVALFAHYLKGVGNDSAKLVECDMCLGRSPEALEGCPYCLEDPAAGAKGSPKAAETGKGQHPKEKAHMNKTTTKEEAPQKSLMLAGGTGLATVTPIGKDLSKLTEKTLDHAVKEVQVAKAEASGSMWKLGGKIAAIYDGQLWKLRSEDGKPRYKTPDAFCVAELGMSVTHAWSLMDLHKKFTEAEVAKFGTSKLGLLLQAPEAARPAIRESIEKGATKQAVAAEVKRANQGKETVQRRDGKEQKSSAPTRAKNRAEGKKEKPALRAGRATITIANMTGSQTIPMWKKASMVGDDKKEWVRAKRIADVPTCRMELANDVVQDFTLVEHTDGTLKLKIVTARAE
jgi:hypothetical protein